MKIFKLAAVVAAATLIGTGVSAATIGYTEGKRATVAGTVDIIGPDVTATAPGFDLGNIGLSTAIHGRIVESNDFYQFTSSQDFKVDWIFGGFDLENGGSAAQSGFTSVPFSTNGGPIDIVLRDLATDTVVASVAGLVTEIIAGPSNIFGAVFAGGNYELGIFGNAVNPEYDALYDIKISAVPLPAGILLMGTALGGLGLMRRRKRTTTV